MKINYNTVLCHITTVPESLSFLTGQIGYMRHKGFEVYAISSPGSLANEFALSEHVRVHSVNMPRRITPFIDLRALRHLRQKLQMLGTKIIHAHTPKAGLLGMLGGLLAHVPLRIYHIHGLPFITAKGYKRLLLRWCETVSCHIAHQVFCVSASARELAVREGVCQTHKVKVLGNGSINGIDATRRFNPHSLGEATRQNVRKHYGIPSEALVIGFVGRIVRDKGLIEFATAWMVLRESYPDLHLLIVGPFESQDPLPQELIEVLRHDSRVHLTGYVSDGVPSLYMAMDVLVLPSHREGLGLAALEASAMILPVVATRIPGCVDAVVDGVTGTLVPTRDAKALTEAIRNYLKRPKLRREHGEAGRQRVMRDFRPEDIWEATYREYVRLLCRKRLPVPENCWY